MNPASRHPVQNTHVNVLSGHHFENQQAQGRAGSTQIQLFGKSRVKKWSSHYADSSGKRDNSTVKAME